MAGRTDGLIKTYRAGGAIPARRIAKHGGSDDAAILAAAATDGLMGVTSELPVAQGEPVDVMKSGLADVEYGGNVARDAPLTSDASGRAITAAPGAGVRVNIIGFAEVSGVLGDIGVVHISRGSMTG